MSKDQKLAVPPDGSWLISMGRIAAIGGLAVALIGLMSSPYAGPGMTSNYNAWKWPLTWAGVSATNLGVLLLVVGIIVRALSFLPGREVRESEIERVAEFQKMTG